MQVFIAIPTDMARLAYHCYDCWTDLRPMSLEQLKAFLVKIQGNNSLQQKLKAAKSPGDVVAIAREHGHEFTPDKFNSLSEVDLESVAGGVGVKGICNETTSMDVECTL